MINVLTLSEEKIEFLLTNHKYFSPTEITLAAKMKAMNDKKPKQSNLARYQSDFYLRGLQGLQGMQSGGNPYVSGYEPQGIFGGVF